MSHHQVNWIKKKLIVFMTLLLAVACTGLLASCGGDGSTSTQGDTTRNIVSGVSVQSTQSFVGEEMTFTLSEHAGVSVSLIEKPNLSQAQLKKGDSESYSFTADKAGKYTILLTDSYNNTKESSFFIRQNEQFSPEEIIQGTGNTPTTGQVKNQYHFQTNLTEDSVKALLDGIPGIEVIEIESWGRVFIKVDPNSDSAISAFEGLKNNSEFRYYGNRIINDTPQTFYTPDDGSLFDDEGDNWHLEKIKATSAWDITKGSQDIKITVMDNYLHTNHEEIKGRFDRVKNQKDKSKHGTAVTSIIAGTANNRKGVSGINHVSKVDFLAYYYDYGKAYKEACESDLKTRVVNHSWGMDYLHDRVNPNTGEKFGSHPLDAAPFIRNKLVADPLFFFLKTYAGLSDAREYLKTSKCLTVMAAGNDYVDAKNSNGSIHYEYDLKEQGSNPTPQKLNNTIVVAAFLKNENLAAFSNYGESIDIAAPTKFKAASEVSSLVLDSYYEVGDQNKYGTDVNGPFGGTSAAAPVVTGVASLVFSKYPWLTAAEVKRILIESATEFVTHRENESEITNGGKPILLYKPIPILNAKAALDLAAKVAVSPPPEVSFSYSPLSPKVDDVVIFNPTIITSNNAKVASIKWSYGDDGGVTTTVNSPVQYSYKNEGKYTVQISVTDEYGGTNVATQIISVNAKASATKPDLSINFGPGSQALLGAQNFQAVDFISGKEGRYAAKFGGVENPGYIRIPNQDAMKFVDGATFDLYARMDSMIGMDGWGSTVTNGAYAMTLLAKSHDRTGISFLANSMTGTGGKSWSASFDPSMAGACESMPNPSIPLGTWVRVTYTMSSSNGIRGYLDKKLVWQCPDARPDFSTMNGQDLYIGKFNDTWYPLNGAIQDIRIYKKTLTETEVKALQ